MVKLIILLLLIPIFSNSFSQRFYEKTFYPDNFYDSQYFGYDVILTDTNLFISAIRDDSLGNSSGSLYFYRKTEQRITFVKKILATDGKEFDAFGVPFYSSNFLYVGAIGNRGGVYVFEYKNNEWVQIQKLVPDTMIFLSSFGKSIREFNNELFIGASSDSRYVEDSGALYIFKKEINGLWKRYQKIYPPIMKEHAHFGHKCELNTSHNHLFVSAPEDENNAGRFAGNVYVLHKKDSLWEIRQILSPDIGEEWPYFGSSLATKGDYLFVGAPGVYLSQTRSCIYVYQIKNGIWTFVKKIFSPENSFIDYFGYSMIIEGDSLLIGAPRYFNNRYRLAKAYLYSIKGENLDLEYIFEPKDSIYQDGFGIGLAINKGVFLIGAPFGKKNGISTGKAYLFSQDPLSISIKNELSNNFQLFQNYPNPFNPTTKISWQSPVGGHQTLKVFDVLGREVATLVDEYREAGYHEVSVSSKQLAVGNSIPSGVYFYQLKVGDYVQTKKMMLIR